MKETSQSSDLKNQLLLEDISFWINIGITEEERSKPQEVLISVRISFLNTPSPTLTDSLNSKNSSEICYEDVILSLKSSLLTSQSFHLIEHLAYKCYQSLRKKWSSSEIQFQISVKKFPSSLPELKGGAHYTFGD